MHVTSIRRDDLPFITRLLTQCPKDFVSSVFAMRKYIAISHLLAESLESSVRERDRATSSALEKNQSLVTQYFYFSLALDKWALFHVRTHERHLQCMQWALSF